MKIKLRLIQWIWKIYRPYLKLNFNKQQEILFKRKGYCKKCALCCGNCVYLDKKTKLCKNREMSIATGCALFPSCPLHLKVLGLEGKCGFYWEKK